MCGIYKITNQLNGKVYIGQSRDIESRWKRHQRYPIDSKKPLYLAFKKYGLKNFSFEVIEECPEEDLNEREQYWIIYYNSYGNGYNATRGGEGNRKVDVQQIIDSYNRLGMCTEVSKELNVSAHTVGKILTQNGVNHYLSTEAWKYKCKPVAQYTKDDVFVQQFDSLTDAARYLINIGVTKTGLRTIQGHIGECCRGKHQTVYGYKWKFL